MEDYQVIRKQYLQIYDFSAVADAAAPKGGQLAVITNTPDFGSLTIILITDGTKTIRELYNAWKASQLLNPQDLAAMVGAETQSRQQADAALQQNIDSEAQARRQAVQAEAQSRQQADAALRQNINTLTTYTKQNLALKAPIYSPKFTGIPEVTLPDYTVPLQAVPVSELVDALNLIRNITYGRWRTYEREINQVRPRYRCYERGDGNFHLTRKFERSIL